MRKKYYPTIIATDGQAVVVEKLNKLPQALTLFDDLNKVAYKGDTELSERELQQLFDEFKIKCFIIEE